MKTTNNTRKSKFLAFLLSVMMLSSAGALFASCADGEDSSSSSSTSSTETEEETRTDDGLIKNANFDFTTLSSKTVIATSVTGWSRSVNSNSSGSADSSTSKSGVIDTSDDAWKYLTDRKYTDDQLKEMSDATAVADWANFKVQDKLAYYDIWKAREENDGKSISTDFEAYESINVDEEDIPTVANPGKHDASLEDSNVLMLHNHYYTSSSTKEKPIGTAQKFTSSSSVTIPAGSSATFSVWVKTADLKSAATGNEATQDAVGKGAYISITHSVGGKSLDAYEVKNIATDDWKQYTFYIKGSYYADTTFSVVLGLGQGTKNDKLEYVNGYAFFDDIQCEIIDNNEYDTKTTGLTAADLDDEKIDKTVDAYKSTADKFAMNFYGDAWETVDVDDAITGTATVESDGSNVNPDAASTDVVKVYENQAEIQGEKGNNEYLGYVYDYFFADTDFVKDSEILMFLSTNGTAYTAEKVMKFTMDANVNNMAVSFFVKTSDLNGGTGAGITLVDALNKTSFTSIDTSSIEGVTVGDDEDAYDGWQQVFFFLERGEDVAVTTPLDFYLTFNYGPTDITSSTAKTSFAQGFAAFAKFTQRKNMSELEYDTAATGTYAKKVTLLGVQEDKASGNNGFDTAAGVPEDALEKGLAITQNYKGVYNDNYRVSLPLASDNDAAKEEKRSYNTYANAGLLNRENFADVMTASAGEAWLQDLVSTSGAATAADVWNYHFGDATQPLVIWNGGLSNRSYGYIGSSTSLSSDYTAVSLRVKTTAGAKASIYLMDMEDSTRQTVLSISRSLTYWYDEDGNVCTGDPSKNSTFVAFKLQKNGLYKANKNWDGYEKLGAVKDEYFANLSAYTEIDGVLYAADNSASHDYYDYTWNREVFYKHSDNNYYTEKEGGVKVVDLASVTKMTDGSTNPLEARYLPEATQELKLENIDTNGEWATVTFYIHKGVTAKNYRLEVWSGTRNGSTVNTAGYVAFDTNNPGTAQDNFALIDDYKDLEGVKSFEGVFSYYDTNQHVRYDADLDADKSGNAYEDNIKTKYSSSTADVAYLSYKNSNGTLYNIFADYSLFDQEVAAKTTTDDTTTDDSTEDEEDEEGVNVWLLASSIAVAGVLVLVVLSIVIRKVVANLRKKHGTRVRKPKTKKTAAPKKAEKTVDEDSPYND
ncbi:MAG: hypothetical protein IJ284_01625 [Clostridia bacterium]|nr:hypothetical protein [Clostridia bacterium]